MSIYKEFKTYEEAYALYSDIVSGRDTDRKNATITYVSPPFRIHEHCFVVFWEPITTTKGKENE